LNAVVLARTRRAPKDLLGLIHALEAEAGRDRTIRFGPRTLDVDLVLFGDRIIRDPVLTVPHPRWKERSFVVLPLSEIAAEVRDPETGWTVAELARKWPMEPKHIRVVAEGDPGLLPDPTEGA
jgi:2-amino-4-hydroxy-6-hydroxymethyldihydropteridine diphosphokinase